MQKRATHGSPDLGTPGVDLRTGALDAVESIFNVLGGAVDVLESDP